MSDYRAFGHPVVESVQAWERDQITVTLDDGRILALGGIDLAHGPCDTCDSYWPRDRYNPTCTSPRTCFRCRALGLGVGFQGGKEFFHNDTVTGSVKRMVNEFAANNDGQVPVPKTTSVTGGFASVSQETRLKAALGG
jgi:hypothetical protein